MNTMVTGTGWNSTSDQGGKIAKNGRQQGLYDMDKQQL